MIDYAVYKRLHDDDKGPPPMPVQVPYDPWPIELSINDTLEGDQYLMLPPQMPAFYLKEKEWSK
jgi:hypothetical protein